MKIDKIKNKHIRGTVQIGRYRGMVRELRLRLFERVQRRDARCCREKDVGIGTAKQENRKAKGKIYGCCERGHADANITRTYTQLFDKHQQLYISNHPFPGASSEADNAQRNDKTESGRVCELKANIHSYIETLCFSKVFL